MRPIDPFHFQKVTDGLDVVPLVMKIHEQPHLWDEIRFRQEAPGSAHHDTEAIFLRWCPNLSLEAVFKQIEAMDFPAAPRLMPAAGQLVQSVIDAIGDVEEIGRIMVVSLHVNGAIDKHVDEGAYADHYDRFHVALSSYPGNMFYVGDQQFEAKEGELWWFNHKLPHYVENKSIYDRWHLILDLVSPKYRALRDLALAA